MSTKTHTPGPWHIGPTSKPDTEFCIADTDATIICRFDRWHNEAEDEQLANARLIAAAPELLDVLIDILIDQETEPGNINTWPDPPGIESAREVLKKHGMYPANIKRA